MILVAALAGVGLLASAFQKPDKTAPEPATERAESLELVVWDGGKLARWEVRVEVDGKSVPDHWDAAFGQLFTFADGDGKWLTRPQGRSSGFRPRLGCAKFFGAVS